MKVCLPLVLIALLACGRPAPKDSLILGSGITKGEMTKISDILSNPSEFVDKVVVVSGKIDAVCPMQGCWIDVLDEKSNERIKVKVEDGKIVFPMESEGQMVTVEGKVEKLNMTKDEYISYKEHEAEERGKEFDQSTITVPEATYRVWGLGAKIAQ